MTLHNDAIEPFRNDRFFREALGIGRVPSSAWLRQRMERMAAALREETDAYSVRLLRSAKAPVTALNGFVCLDFDTFVMDNSGTKKEWVSRTYQGVDGYTPIAAYLGNEGWCLALELRPGSQHSALETHFFLERALPRARELVPAGLPVLSRSDSGFDSVRLLSGRTTKNGPGRWKAAPSSSWSSGTRASSRWPPGPPAPTRPVPGSRSAPASGWRCWT